MHLSNYGGEEDMFVIVTYDVDRKRCAKVMKYLRQWLEHRQRSVFSGFLTQTQVRVMQHGIRNLINPEYDSIIIFQSNRANQVSEWTTGAAERVHQTGMITQQKKNSPSGQKENKSKKRFRF